MGVMTIPYTWFVLEIWNDIICMAEGCLARRRSSCDLWIYVDVMVFVFSPMQQFNQKIYCFFSTIRRHDATKKIIKNIKPVNHGWNSHVRIVFSCFYLRLLMHFYIRKCNHAVLLKRNLFIKIWHIRCKFCYYNKILF